MTHHDQSGDPATQTRPIGAALKDAWSDLTCLTVLAVAVATLWAWDLARPPFDLHGRRAAARPGPDDAGSRP